MTSKTTVESSPSKKFTEKFTTFRDLLEKTLKKYKDPTWLGRQSPLATPYFLGEYLEANGMTDEVARGKALQKLLRESIDNLQAKDVSLYQDILRLSYLESRSAVQVADMLNMGRTTLYEHRPQAIMALENAIISLARPSLRLETLPTVKELFGYEKDAAQLQQTLLCKQSIAITGNVGSGKTAFGRSIAQKYTSGPVFWFTIHPGLNDQRDTLLFELGYFFHIHGASALWLQLVADGGKISQKLFSGLIHFCLEQFEGNLPLLCFDQVDQLRPMEDNEHNEIVAILNRLHKLIPILFMGQQTELEIDLDYPLSSLSLGVIRAWFEARNLNLSVDELKNITAATLGNPRLLELFMTLSSTKKEGVDQLLDELSNSLSVESMLTRVMAQLNPRERQIIFELSVFRRSAPADEWTRQKRSANVVERLIEWGLVQEDGQGGIALLPIYRANTYRHLPPEEREMLHYQAAQRRSQRGAYTAAIYHLVQADAAEEAILLWHQHQRQEIEQGQARAAFAILKNISSSRLSQNAKEFLHQALSELEILFANYAGGQSALDSIEWKSAIKQIFVAEQTAYIASTQSRFEAAELAYGQALAQAENLVENRLIHIHKDRGWVQMRRQELEAAWREVQLAKYQVEDLQGTLQLQLTNWHTAEDHYLAAYSLAQELGYKDGIAKTANNLGILYDMRGDLERAKTYMEQAIDYYNQMGKMTAITGMKINGASYYLHAGEYDRAMALAGEARDAFSILSNPWGQALASHILADVHLALGNLDQAEQFVHEAMALEDISLMPEVHQTLGEIQAAQRHFPEAEKQITLAIEAALANSDLRLEAYAYRALGKVYGQQQKSDQANAAFDKAIELFERLKLDNEVAATSVLKVYS